MEGFERRAGEGSGGTAGGFEPHGAGEPAGREGARSPRCDGGPGPVPEGVLLVAVSACLCGVPCRFDGKAKGHAGVQRFLEGLRAQGGEALEVCPEREGGLPTPRPACEIVSRDPLRIVTQAGEDRTSEYVRGAQEVARRLAEAGCRHAILKAKSPSCGIGCVYDGSFSGRLAAGDGVTAALLREAGVACWSEEAFED